MASHPKETSVMPIGGLESSTALFHGLGDIELVNHGDREYSPQGREQWDFLGDLGVDAWPLGGRIKYASDSADIEPERIYRREQILSVDTDRSSSGSLIIPQIIDQRTINNITQNSFSLSPETNRQQWKWTRANAQRQFDFAQPCDLQKHWASSFSNTAELSDSKWAVSGSTRSPSTNTDLFTGSDCFLDITKHRTYEQAYTWDSRHQFHPQTSLDNGVFHLTDTVPSTENHQSSTFVNYPAPFYSPAEDAQATSTLTPDVNTRFKAHVASEAVVEAAKRRRRHYEARVFECLICSYQLTTKQNLQYHIAAHYGKRDHLCGRCGKSFTTPHTRTRHEARCQYHVSPIDEPSG